MSIITFEGGLAKSDLLSKEAETAVCIENGRINNPPAGETVESIIQKLEEQINLVVSNPHTILSWKKFKENDSLGVQVMIYSQTPKGLLSLYRIFKWSSNIPERIEKIKETCQKLELFSWRPGLKS